MQGCIHPTRSDRGWRIPGWSAVSRSPSPRGVVTAVRGRSWEESHLRFLGAWVQVQKTTPDPWTSPRTLPAPPPPGRRASQTGPAAWGSVFLSLEFWYLPPGRVDLSGAWFSNGTALSSFFSSGFGLLVLPGNAASSPSPRVFATPHSCPGRPRSHGWCLQTPALFLQQGDNRSCHALITSQSAA